jgi:hypothetical protein
VAGSAKTLTMAADLTAPPSPATDCSLVRKVAIAISPWVLAAVGPGAT